MDPLSITTSVVALLGVSGACAKFLRKIVHNANHAPDEILALSNDISDMNLIVSDLEANARELEEATMGLGESLLSSSLRDHLNKARSIINNLEAIASDLFAILPNGKFKFQKIKWLRRQSEVVTLRRDLVDIKNSLNTILSSRIASNVARIRLSLRDIRIGASAQSLSNINLEVLSRNFESNTSLVKELDSTEDDFQAQPQSPDTSEEMMRKMMATVRQISQFGSIIFHLQRTVRCYGTCACACHSRSQMQTPQFLEQVFGRLFIGYAGLPIFAKDCDQQNCTNQYSRAAQIIYTFPGWLLARTFDATVAITYTNELHFGLKVRNRVQNGENSVFSLARSGNISGIKELYVQRLISPNDLCYTNGQTALHFALQCANRLETVGFLLDTVKVDPYHKEDRGWCAAQDVSMDVLTKQNTTRGNRDHQAIFSKIPGDHAEIWDFSYIHSIVVGIHHSDLHSTLLDPRYRDLVDVPDVFNRTPLFWAALRGDTRKVEILLTAGANPAKCDRDGGIPLHAAIKSGSIPCVKVFLTRGSLIHYRDFFGSAAIQIAAAYDDNEAMLETLYLAGASVNVEMEYGTSVLASAACCNNPRSVEWLIRKGANMEYPDVVGYTPLLEAIRYCNTEAAEVLLRHGASVEAKTQGGRTVLHVLASTGTLESANMLLKYPLPGLEAQVRDNKSKTAWEIFQDRVGPPAGMRDAFIRLLAHVNAQQSSDDSSHEDFFEDASDGL